MDDRESDAYSEGYQQGRLDSQRNGQVKNEKAESENFWKPHSDYLDEYDCWMQVIFGQRKLRLIAERVELKIFLIQKN